jgi:N-acetylmuramoyl-L-alanine amidase
LKLYVKSLLAIALLLGAWHMPVSEALAAGNPVNGYTICIDPGHQRYGNNEQEPIGPGAKETKPKVSSGTTGVVTKKPEYVLNLEVSLLIRDKLEAMGYRVVMTRSDHDVDLSNRERAEIANEAKADLFLRIHADGDASNRAQGISIQVPSKDNPYTEGIAAESKQIGEYVLEDLLSYTEAKSRGLQAREDLSGFNWVKVPSILVEMGFMSNPDEDRKMSTLDYQDKLASGISNGIDRYFRDVKGKAPVEALDAAWVLTKTTTLNEKIGSRFIATPYALNPQTVQGFEKMGNWIHIHTWLGDMWVQVNEGMDF